MSTRFSIRLSHATATNMELSTATAVALQVAVLLAILLPVSIYDIEFYEVSMKFKRAKKIPYSVLFIFVLHESACITTSAHFGFF